MQRVKNGIKALFLTILSAALIFGIAVLCACGNSDEEEGDLVSGEYIVDVSWTGGMNNWMTLVVNINAEDSTFNQYYTSSSSISKGSGTISYSKGVYTMTYSDISVDGVNTTTFTFDSESGAITFTSALLWGSSSFDTSTTTSDGTFATFQAQPIVASGEYNVDLEWTGGMAAHVTAIVNIDMSAMSFNLYYQSSPDTSKGTGKVIYSDGVYTLSYSEAVNEVSETTFTYDYTTKTITFTSALLWGSGSFDSSSTTEDGSFAPYTAAFVESSDAEQTATAYENYTDYINTDSTTHAVSEGVVTYSIVTKTNSPAGAFTITVAVGSDKTVSAFIIETNGSTGGYEANMFDTSTLIGKTESELSSLLSAADGSTISTGATKSNTLCVYAALFAVGNYDICVAGV